MAKKTNLLFTLDLFILSFLKESDCYGYQLMKLIADRTNHLIDPKMGTLYPVLHNLLDNGYITSYEVYIKTKPRVYYHIEDKGLIYLEKLILEFDTLVDTIRLVIHKEREYEE